MNFTELDQPAPEFLDQRKKSKYPFRSIKPGKGIIIRLGPEDPPIQRQYRLLSQAISYRQRNYPGEQYTYSLLDHNNEVTTDFAFAAGIAIWRVK